MTARQQPTRPSKPTEDDRFSEGGLRAPAHYSTLRKMWWWFDFVILVKLARLRFIAILTAIGLLIVYWDALVSRYDKWTRPFSAAGESASADAEYFCPMHPQVVTANSKEKCPICFMNLSKRKKGDGSQEEALPAGVVTRLQLSPYRVAAAGIQTWQVKYEALLKNIETVGAVEFDERKLARIAARVTGKSRIDKLFANVTGAQIRQGDPLAMLYSPDLLVTVQNLQDARTNGNRDLERMARDRLKLWGIEPDQIETALHKHDGTTHLIIRSPISGYIIRKYQVEGEYVEEGARLYDVADLSTVWIEAQVYEDDMVFLSVGLPVTATVKAVPNRTYPGKVAFLNPHLDAATRTVPVRFDIENADRKLKPGMFAKVRIDVPSAALGEQLQTRGGRVLAVPDGAVIHTGSQQIVYRQSGPTVFDAVAVELGPSLTDAAGATFHPVVRGLENGDQVATVGSYLLDAETRVSSAAGSIYYGGGGGGGKSEGSTSAAIRPSTPEDEDVKVRVALAKLSTPDRRLAEAQKRCPVLGGPLGAMGTPVKVVLDDEPVLLCCKACEKQAREHSAATKERVRRFKQAAPTNGMPPDLSRMETPSSASAPDSVNELPDQSGIRQALAKLNEPDRLLAERQVYCPIVKEHLGSMGPPVKVVIKGRTVFLCCKSCEKEAIAHPDETLKTIDSVKAKSDAGKTLR